MPTSDLSGAPPRLRKGRAATQARLAICSMSPALLFLKCPGGASPKGGHELTDKIAEAIGTMGRWTNNNNHKIKLLKIAPKLPLR